MCQPYCLEQRDHGKWSLGCKGWRSKSRWQLLQFCLSKNPRKVWMEVKWMVVLYVIWWCNNVLWKCQWCWWAKRHFSLHVCSAVVLFRARMWLAIVPFYTLSHSAVHHQLKSLLSHTGGVWGEFIQTVKKRNRVCAKARSRNINQRRGEFVVDWYLLPTSF